MKYVGLRDLRVYVGLFGSLAMVLSLLWCEPQAWAKSDYEIINTGIKGSGCWVDDSHFVMVKGQQPAPGQEFEVEGLYYLDPTKPKDLKRVDLSPIESSLQLHIRDVTCQAQHILFKLRSNETGLWRLYSLVIGSEPELIAEMRGGGANLIGHYVASKFRRSSAVEAQGMTGIGIYEAAVDCGIKYVKPGFKGLCVDTWMESGWGLPSLRFVKYIWYETIKVKNKNGQVAWIPNPEPPLKLPDGTELKQGYLLRDLENHIVREIPVRQGAYKVDAISFKPSPGGGYLYALCSKTGDYNPPVTFYGRVCRFKLSESDTQWEEVLSIQKEPNEQASLDNLDVNDQGDVVVIRRAKRASPMLWKYTARRASVEHLPVPQLSQEIGVIQLAPDGQTISYVDKGQLVFVRSQGGKP